MDTGDYTVIHNNNYQLKEFFRDHAGDCFGGFNNKHYDDWIIQSMVTGADNATVKEHNDFIIGGGNGWEFPYIAFQKKYFNSFDLRDDIPDKGLSLKAIEGNLHLPIVESSIPFDYPDPLNKDQLAEVIEYCKYDVDSTYELFLKRTEYLNSKRIVAKLKGLTEAEGLKQTNAKLSAIYLDAKRVERDDERDYRIPDNIHKEIIPQKILDFFDKIHDQTIPSEKLFKTKLKITLGGCPCVYGWGGVHGAIPNYINEETPGLLIRNRDVESLYPNSMRRFGYVSRNVADPEAYGNLVDKRLKAKHDGDKDTASALKLVINTTYGAMLNQYNDLSDPWAGRSVCITNQLAMTDLVITMIRDIKSFKIVNFNTDGVMYEITPEELPIADAIVEEWENRTGLKLEEDKIHRVIQKDVNNYIEVQEDGKVKVKGAYVKYMDEKDWTDNQFKTNSLKVTHKAVVDYFVKGVLPEETIRACDNIFEFQMIAKTGATYSGSYHEIDGKHCDVQKVNRVYASKDPRYGTVKKIKKAGADKVAGLPDHCIIDNENELSVSDIDLQFYIDLSYERIIDYIDSKLSKKIKAEKKKGSDRPLLEKFKEDLKMANATQTKTEDVKSLNVFQKLLLARGKFLASDTKKTGKNTYANFKFFQLEDIVPTTNAIFTELGLVLTTSFTWEKAIGILINTEKPEEMITFESPMRNFEIEGVTKMNAIQALGAYETYQRRYLYMMTLDIVEADEIDLTGGQKEESKAGKPVGSAPAQAPKSNRPASNEDRAKATEELTGVDNEATEAEVKAVKAGLKKLRARYVENKEITNQELADKYEPLIKESLAKIKGSITKKEIEDLLITIGEKVAEV